MNNETQAMQILSKIFNALNITPEEEAEYLEYAEELEEELKEVKKC